MGRQLKPVRLWLRRPRPRVDRATPPPTWVILDRGRQIATGCGEGERIDAEAKLQAYVEGAEVSPERTNYVYFLTAQHEGFPIKIGITANRFARFSTIQTSLPYDLHVIGFLPTKNQMGELAIHRRFRHLRLRGEWFERAPELTAFIESLELESGAPAEPHFRPIASAASS